MAVINLGNGDDNTFGTLLTDTIYGNGGNDTISALDSDDVIYGGSSQTAFNNGAFDGNDLLNGNWGHDLIYGGTGNDQLFGGSGKDTLHGGYGNDLLIGGGGNDALFGNEGDDTLIGSGKENSGSLGISIGKGEIDYLSAGTAANNGKDTFYLGQKDHTGTARVFYDDQVATTAGLADYAQIAYFNKNEDKIKLAGSKSLYILKNSPISLGLADKADTGVYLKGTNGAANELIAVIQDVAVGQLSLASDYFKTI
ncbi:calcium-binding protein [Leptolyngbya sp. FACHB-16]|nr:calcium-binding protein [Leptolyngbya sp. FACHB-16]